MGERYLAAETQLVGKHEKKRLEGGERCRVNADRLAVLTRTRRRSVVNRREMGYIP